MLYKKVRRTTKKMTKISEAELLKKRPIPFYYITTHDPEELTYEKFYDDL